MSYQPYLIAPYSTGISSELEPWLLPKDAFQTLFDGFIRHGVLSKRAGISLLGAIPHAPGPTFPALPVMGIPTFIDTDGALQILAFDTKRGSIFNTGTNSFDPLDVADIFNGNESSFLSWATFGKTGAFGTSTLFFTNFNGDTSLPISPMRTFTTGNTTSTFVPDSTPNAGTRNYIIASQFIFPLKQRLILLNTVESTSLPVGVPPVGSGTNYPQRMRWCRAGNPAASGDNWDEITPGNGGFVDAPTSEVIVGAKALQGQIIVFFTNSVWTIKPTADPALPFRFDKINDFRANDCSYATLGHDRYVISFGKRGIIATDSVEVNRMDQKIEGFMTQEVNAQFYNRMYSGRDYTNLRSWTLFPSPTNDVNPIATDEVETSNRALVRTDEEGAWSVYRVALKDQSADGTNMSSLGYGEITSDLAWQDFTGDLDLAWEEFGETDTWWSFFYQGNSEVFLGGDQTGRVLFLERGGNDMGEDIGFEAVSAGWNPYKEQGVQCQMGYVDFYVDADTDTKFQVDFYADDINNPYVTQTMDCLPNLGYIADIQNISLVNPVEITADSHGLEDDDQIFIYNLEGAGQLTGGPYTITIIDENTFTLDGVDGTVFDPYIQGGTVVEREFNNQKCWKRAYAGGKGYLHYIRITNNGKDDVLKFNAFMPWFRPVGGRMTT